MKKICSECNTENELHYMYCKNCGNPLEGEEQVQPPVVQTPEQAPQTPPAPPQNPYGVQTPNMQYNYTYNAPDAPFMPDSVGGIDKSEFITFIGNNGEKIYSKFAKMEYSGSKVSWCWPAAILTACCGIIGGAIWFFYRKMYKIAVILMAIGIVFTAAQTALTYNAQSENGKIFFDSFSKIFEELEEGNPFADTANEEIHDIEEAPDGKLNKLLSGIADILDAVQTYAGTALIGMFAMYFYKKHSVEKITAYKATAVDPQYYSYCLGLVGGTSGGMLALGIIIAVLVNTVADGVSAIPFFSGFGGL